jgi:negative regulator of sigma E activity
VIANMMVAIQVVWTDTPHGPWRPSTGTASRVKATSQPNTTAAQAIPILSVRPRPWISPAPPVTTSAAATMAGRGRDRSSSGPATASSGGTQATATPSTAGSA